MADSVSKPEIFIFREHQEFSQAFTEEELNKFQELKIEFSPSDGFSVPKYLGLSSSCASYYVGASWLTKDKAVVVLPKLIDKDQNEEIDLMRLFISALEYSPSAEYFSDFYGINYDEDEIECNALSECLTPLLIIHFLKVLEKIFKHGLKKDYVIREENLHSKICGKIMIQQHLQKNVFNGRADKIYCRFQEYTADILENRILKKALLFSKNYINRLESFSYHNSLYEIKEKILKYEVAFCEVGNEVEIQKIKTFRQNKLFKNYSEGLKLAKMILQRFDYSLSKTEESSAKVPPFWIDMSRLFEIYVYGKLEKAFPGQIIFQAQGKGNTACDFVHKGKGIILDAKYKTRYQNSNAGILDDIREISGYARDNKILALFDKSVDKEKVLPCVIIYPELQQIEVENEDDKKIQDEIKNQKKTFTNLKENSDINDLLTKENKIPGFKEFYKISIELPYKSEKQNLN